MKLISAICASTLALAGTGTANATTYTPAGTFVLQGPVVFSKGITLNCTFKITFTVPEAAPDAHGAASHGHSASAVPQMLTPASPFCPTVTFSSTPYPVSYDGTNLTLSGVIVNTTFSGTGCAGPLSGVWNNMTKKLTLNASIPSSGPPPCTIVGVLSLVSGTISITNP
ncbi:hypothetical protein [Sphingomonas sp.]|uniref:hypothetical protein n=1 Tax=Sphingomonas sp. TaxID=28214 RepID=UPI003D6C7036